MSAGANEAAREWLEHFIELYAGMDTASETDPIRAAREAARSALAAGATQEDPYRIATMAADALPDDPRAAALADEWHAELLRAEDDRGEGPIAG